MLVSALSLVASVVLLIVFAALRGRGVEYAYAHMAIAAMTAIGFAAKFMIENGELRSSGARHSAIAACTARYTGYVAAWGAICLLTIYATGILRWREWLTFSIGCIVIAGLSLVLASMLQRDADAAHDDPGLLKVAHYMGIGLLAGMVITIVGFLIDGKMVRFLNPAYGDWAANNIFFFGATALAAIAGHALKHKRA